MPRRTAVEAEQTRVAVLAAAKELFTEQGFAATSTAQVADRAGVTRGALYHHFHDKTDLFRDVFMALTDELNTAIVEAGTAELPDSLAGLRAGCRVMLEFCSGDAYRQISVLDAPSVLGLEEWQRLDAAVGMATFTGALDLLVADGHLAAVPDRATVVLWFGSLTQASLVSARGGDDAPTIDEMVGAIERMIVGR